MLDVSGLLGIPGEGGQNEFVFYNTRPVPWYKPRYGRLALIRCIGAGGGGGNGFSGANATNRGGGGGGGSGAVTRLAIPLSILPDRLFVACGLGGNPGVAGTASYISVEPTGNDQMCIVKSPGGGTGGNGTSTAAGTAGTAGTAATNNTMVLGAFHGTPLFTAGPAGALGGAHTGAVGASINLLTISHILTGGAGGAGVNAVLFGGGNIVAYSNVPGIYFNANVAGGTTDGQDGANGVFIRNPMPVSTGGAGGAGSLAGTGGRGGWGAFGCGGGGGGAGVTGGAGGRGGNGIIWISIV